MRGKIEGDGEVAKGAVTEKMGGGGEGKGEDGERKERKKERQKKGSQERGIQDTEREAVGKEKKENG